VIYINDIITTAIKKTSFISHLELMFIKLFNSLGIKATNGSLDLKVELSAKLPKEEGQTYADMTDCFNC